MNFKIITYSIIVLITIYLSTIVYTFSGFFVVGRKISNNATVGNLLLTSYNLVNQKLKPSVNPEAILKIITDDENINELNESLPKSGFEYKNASFIDENDNYYNAKIRYRGDMWRHWAFPRKSWRIKLKNKKKYRGNSTFNLILPKFVGQINNHMSYLLAKQMDLLAPESFFTNLSINGEYDGTKLCVEQLNEDFLIKNNKKNSILYKGDNIKPTRIEGIYGYDVFDASYFWKSKSVIKNDTLDYFKQVLYELDQRNYEHIDIEKFAKLSVFISLVNTHHMDENHNWVMVYDKETQKLEPVIWDPIGWGPTYPPEMHVITAKIFEVLYTDIDFVRTREKEFVKFYKEEKDVFLSKLDIESEKATKLIQSNDYYITRDQFAYGRIFDSLEQIELFKQGIEKIRNHINTLPTLSLIKPSFYTQNENELTIGLESMYIISKIQFEYEGELIKDSIIISSTLNGKSIHHNYFINHLTDSTFEITANLISDYHFVKDKVPIIKFTRPIMTTFNLNLNEGINITNVTGYPLTVNSKPIFFQPKDITNESGFFDKNNIF